MASEDDYGAGAAIFLAIPIGIIVGIAIVLFLTITEAARIYAKRAWPRWGTPVAKLLWAALMVFLLFLTGGTYMMLEPLTFDYGAYLASWSFLLWALLIEICDKYMSQFDPEPEQFTAPSIGGELEDFLTPSSGATDQSTNGSGQVRPGIAIGA